jgi:hypothetical protein
MDGMTIAVAALILRHLQSYHKVDMYSEIGAVKKNAHCAFTKMTLISSLTQSRVSNFK